MNPAQLEPTPEEIDYMNGEGKNPFIKHGNEISEKLGRYMDQDYHSSLKVNGGNKMDINEYTKQKGQFLKASDVAESPSKVFIPKDEGEMVENQKYGGTRLHIVGEMDTKDYTFDMSKTNARTVADKLGEDTKKWIGTQLKLETYKTKTSDGKMVDAINVSGTQ